MKSAIIFTALLLGLNGALAGSGILIGDEDAVELAERLVNETQEIYDEILAGKPYHPSLFAWGMHYLARAYMAIYEIGGNTAWFWRALDITEYFAKYSDVNADGEPSWGSYNDTWGIPKWDYKEYTVWDAVNCLPMIEAAMLVRSTPEFSADTELSARAEAYLDIVRRVVTRHYPFWTQMGPDRGYYWDDPTEDVGPYVNGFAALGLVELLLYEATGNETYLERPREMANYLLANMRYNETDDLYEWDYLIGSGPPEDISHGAIDLEFLMAANRAGLVDSEDIIRLCNTYQKRIWQVRDLPSSRFPLSMRVDGSGDSDYTDLSRVWIRLASYVPEIYEQQRLALGVFHERYGLGAAGFIALAAVEVPMMAARLASEGIDVSTFEAVSVEDLEGMLDRVSSRLDDYRAFSVNATVPEALLQGAAEHIKLLRTGNASVPIAAIWEAWSIMGAFLEEAEEVEAILLEAESDLLEAARLGVQATDLNESLLSLWEGLKACGDIQGLQQVSDSVIEWRLNLSMMVAAHFIGVAQELVVEAKQRGIDTSRHEILLGRAREEFEKGNYGSARYFTEYPLRLREELPGALRPSLPVLILVVLLVASWKD